MGGTDQAGGVSHPPESVLALGRRSGRFPPLPYPPPRWRNGSRVGGLEQWGAESTGVASAMVEF